jgi:predicted ATPase
VQLFVEGVISNGHPFELNDNDAPVVGSICRRLDGIALALGLAAASVSTYGIQGTAALLQINLARSTHGTATALDVMRGVGLEL